MDSKGFVGVFSQPFGREQVIACVESWLKRFEKVEQVTPIGGQSVSALTVKAPDDLIWEKHLQFRVTNGPEFAWVYVSLDSRAMETSGFYSPEIALCLDLLVELPGIEEIIDEKNDRRLDELEAQGVL